IVGVGVLCIFRWFGWSVTFIFKANLITYGVTTSATIRQIKDSSTILAILFTSVGRNLITYISQKCKIKHSFNTIYYTPIRPLNKAYLHIFIRLQLYILYPSKKILNK